jgi:hypothetical protein
VGIDGLVRPACAGPHIRDPGRELRRRLRLDQLRRQRHGAGWVLGLDAGEHDQPEVGGVRLPLGDVTSPAAIADGDYPLTVTVQRAGSPPAASFTSYYKVYSSDTAAPTLYWPSPSDGATVSGRSYNVAVSSNDDHAVKTIALSIDGVSKTATTCAGVSYACQLNYTWSTSRGQHSATFTSTDWMGNVSVMTTTFTVG